MSTLAYIIALQCAHIGIFFGNLATKLDPTHFSVSIISNEEEIENSDDEDPDQLELPL